MYIRKPSLVLLRRMWLLTVDIAERKEAIASGGIA